MKNTYAFHLHMISVNKCKTLKNFGAVFMNMTTTSQTQTPKRLRRQKPCSFTIVSVSSDNQTTFGIRRTVADGGLG